MPVVRGDFVARIVGDRVVGVARRAEVGGASAHPEDHCSMKDWANTHNQAVLEAKVLVDDAAVRAAGQDSRKRGVRDLHAGAATCAKMVARWRREAVAMDRAGTAA